VALQAPWPPDTYTCQNDVCQKNRCRWAPALLGSRQLEKRLACGACAKKDFVNVLHTSGERGGSGRSSDGGLGQSHGQRLDESLINESASTSNTHAGFM
jgi:hypothetical protein